jgi:hypothetical protein
MSQQTTIRLDDQRLGPSRDDGLEALLEGLTICGPYHRFEREAKDRGGMLDIAKSGGIAWVRRIPEDGDAGDAL